MAKRISTVSFDCHTRNRAVNCTAPVLDDIERVYRITELVHMPHAITTQRKKGIVLVSGQAGKQYQHDTKSHVPCITKELQPVRFRNASARLVDLCIHIHTYLGHT
jgi:hypothetical protein